MQGKNKVFGIVRLTIIVFFILSITTTIIHSTDDVTGSFIFPYLISGYYRTLGSDLDCNITTPGSCLGTKLLYLENETGGYDNAHAENVSEANYAYVVCCSVSGDTITTSCDDVVFLRLSNTTNAHVQQNTHSDYSINACISASSGTITCSYGTCSGDEECLLSMASSEGDNTTNAHVASCGHYATEVCCEYEEEEEEEEEEAPPAPPARAGGRLSICTEQWNCSDWGPCMPDGKQYRNCWDLNKCEEKYTQRIVNYIKKTEKPAEIKDCVYEATCDDGVQNQNETDIDCGGICGPICKDGQKCKSDDDCINTCNLEEGICYTPPVVEMPAPPTLWQRFINYLSNKIGPFITKTSNIIIKHVKEAISLYLILFAALILTIIILTRYGGQISQAYQTHLQKRQAYQALKQKEKIKELRSEKALERKKLEEERTRLLEEQKFRRRKELEKEKIKKQKERERKKLEKQKERFEKEEEFKESKKEYSAELNKFLNKAVSAGYSKAQIKKALLEKGWPKKFVDKYCDKFFKTAVQKGVKYVKK